MRLAALASVGVIALSAAAIAQVTGAPEEQKVPAPGSAAVDQQSTADNVTADDSGDDTGANTTSPPANDLAPATPEPQKAPRR